MVDKNLNHYFKQYEFFSSRWSSSLWNDVLLSLVATAGSGESTTTSPKSSHYQHQSKLIVLLFGFLYTSCFYREKLLFANWISCQRFWYINRKRLAVVLEDRIHIYDVPQWNFFILLILSRIRWEFQACLQTRKKYSGLSIQYKWGNWPSLIVSI